MNYENGFICHITIISYASIKFDDYILGLLGYSRLPNTVVVLNKRLDRKFFKIC